MNKPSLKLRPRADFILVLAKRLLAAAALVQLMLFIPDHIIPAQRSFNFVLLASAVLGIIGFLIAYNRLNLKEEALNESSTFDLFGSRLKGAGILMFCLTFFVPLLNLVIIIWTYFRVPSAIRAA